MSDRETQLKHANDCDKSWDSFDPDRRPNYSPTHSRINSELKATPYPDLRVTTLTATGRLRVAAECEPCTVQFVCRERAIILPSIAAVDIEKRPEDSAFIGRTQHADQSHTVDRRGVIRFSPNQHICLPLLSFGLMTHTQSWQQSV